MPIYTCNMLHDFIGLPGKAKWSSWRNPAGDWYEKQKHWANLQISEFEHIFCFVKQVFWWVKISSFFSLWLWLWPSLSRSLSPPPATPWQSFTGWGKKESKQVANYAKYAKLAARQNLQPSVTWSLLCTASIILTLSIIITIIITITNTNHINHSHLFHHHHHHHHHQRHLPNQPISSINRCTK